MTDIGMTLALDKFQGLRPINAVADPLTGFISSVSMTNVELFYSNNGSNVGIRTMKGNRAIASLEDEGNVIYGQWESVQEGDKYWIIYTVNSEGKGCVYNYNWQSNLFELLYDEMKPIPNCNAITHNMGFFDYLFLTNGEDYVAIRMKDTSNKVTVVNMVDYEGRTIKGLALASSDGRIGVGGVLGVHWCVQNNIFDWSTLNSSSIVTTDSAYQDFDREVKALIVYNGSWIAFTQDYSTTMTGNPADPNNFIRQGASGGGCASFGSVLKFDNKVFYYDHKARNMFAYYLYDTGQTRPTDGVADNIRKYFDLIDETRIDRLFLLPCIVEDRNEIWFKIPTKEGKNIILIFDYIKSEWIVRQSQNIESFLVFNNKIYSSYNDKILLEYTDDSYNGQFIGSEYLMNIINMGSDTDLKIPYYPIVFTLSSSYLNDFYIELKYDDNPERLKTKRIVKPYGVNALIFVLDDDDLSGGYLVADDNDLSGGVFIGNNSYNVTVRAMKPTPFKQLQIRIYTEEAPQEFAIKRIELKHVIVKGHQIR